MDDPPKTIRSIRHYDGDRLNRPQGRFGASGDSGPGPLEEAPQASLRSSNESGPSRTSALRLVVSTISVFVLVLVIGLAMMATLPRLFGFQSVVIVSGSMEPTLKVADIVVLAPATEADLGVGNVVNFVIEGENRIHRVVEVLPEGYRTKGDANLAADSRLVRPEEVTGVGRFVVPLIGYPQQWAADGNWLMLALSALVLTVLSYTSRTAFAVGKQRPADPVLSSTVVVRDLREVALS